MSNIAITIEQSKHLIELGLEPDSADMFWRYSASLGNHDINGKIAVSYHDNLFVGKYDGAVPAWSLSALLEVMPKEIKKDDKQYNFHLETTHNLYYVSYYRYDIDGIRYLHTTELYDCIINAAYEIVCWLLGQGLIKKGDNDE